DPVLRYDQSFEVLIRARATALAQLFLAGVELILPPIVALKALIVTFVVLLWAASWRLMTRLGAPLSAAILLLPIAHTFCVFSGFLPYVLSIAPYPFLLIGLMERRRTPARIAGFAGWLLLLYALHIVAAAVGCLSVAM